MVFFHYLCKPKCKAKREGWQELRDFKTNRVGPWALAGDFNVVTSDKEKLGSGPANPSSYASFNACIRDCNLLDLGFAGPPFTWSRGYLKERLDRVLCNDAWLSMFPESSVTHLPIPTSDHCGLKLILIEP